jgi:aspartyl-tRNA(Asn)/glutamyl-tRNA(Gln) amidotransferase subunit B
MTTSFEPVIGLEVHAELSTRSKMFCACEVIDPTQASPNTAVCPVCAGMPGTLPVVNQMAVEYALRVALALDCTINPTSVFARKNYFYPDLPKGYQITQYEFPLAEHGQLTIYTSQGERAIHIRRVHLEEDTGKLTHMAAVPLDNDKSTPTNLAANPYTLLDLNRAGVPLLEIVSEPDLHSVEEARVYAETLRAILRYVGVNSGDMEKGVIRFEANVSVKPVGAGELGTRVEIKNLNSFRALERAAAYEIQRQCKVLAEGGKVDQETLGWDDVKDRTYSQRSKEEAHDYRYFPEPDLPPLVVDNVWVERVRLALPELPREKFHRFIVEYGLTEYAAQRLLETREVADYFEKAARSCDVPAKTVANWIGGELSALANLARETIVSPTLSQSPAKSDQQSKRKGSEGKSSLQNTGLAMEEEHDEGSAAGFKVTPEALAELVMLVERGEINQLTAKAVLAEMYVSGKRAAQIVEAGGLKQVSDTDFISRIVSETLTEYSKEVASYQAGKLGVANFLFGQAMRKAAGKANPQVVKAELEKQLAQIN